jgi:DNA polymerase-3 subunit delta'
MLFKDVIGQDNAKKGFLNFYNAKRLPHAILVNAKEGIGGLAFGLAVSQFLMCENKKESDSCGICNSCIKMQKLVHPDFHLSFPTIPPKPGAKASSKHYMGDFRAAILDNPYIRTFDWLQYINAENKQGNITAEECREISDQLQLRSFEGGNKIQLIWRPEYLGKEGNILLKLIEEPPADTYIILVCENTEDILNTILSRTQEIQLTPIGAPAIAEALIAHKLLEHSQATQIAQIADGSYGNALKYIDTGENDMFGLMKEWFNAVFTNKGIAIHEWVEKVAKLGREQQKQFFLYAQQLLAQSMRYSNIANYNGSLQDEEKTFVQKLAARNFPLSFYIKIDEELSKATYQIERNVHGKTQLMYTSLALQNAIQGN